MFNAYSIGLERHSRGSSAVLSGGNFSPVLLSSIFTRYETRIKAVRTKHPYSVTGSRIIWVYSVTHIDEIAFICDNTPLVLVSRSLTFRGE